MNSNKTKNLNVIAGIITLAIVIIMAVVDFLIFENDYFTYYIPLIPVALFAVILLLARIKGFGYGIGASVTLGILLRAVAENESDIVRIIVLAAITLILIAVMIYKNLK